MALSIVAQRGKLQVLGAIWGMFFAVHILRYLSRYLRPHDCRGVIHEEHEYQMAPINDMRIFQDPTRFPPYRFHLCWQR